MFYSLLLRILPALLATAPMWAQCQLPMQPNLPLGVAGFAYPGSIVHGGAGPWSYQVTQGALPPGLGVAGSSGGASFTGTPNTAGIFDFGLRVTDAAGCSGSGVFQIVIGGALRLDPATLPNGTLSRPYEQTLSMWAGGQPLAITGVTVVAGTMPAGLTVSGSGGAWRVAGIPSQGGSFDFTLEATGGGGYRAQRRYVISISGATGLHVTPASAQVTLRLGDAGQAQQRIDIAAADGGSYRYRITLNAAGFRMENGGVAEASTPFAVNLTLAPMNNTPGVYVGSVVVTPVDGVGPAVTVPIEFIVLPPPTLLVNTSSITVTMRGDDPPVTRAVQVNSSDAALQYQVETLAVTGGNWLALTPFTGTTPAVLTLTFNPTGLSPGTYTGTVRVNATRNNVPAVATPATIAITLVVNPGAIGGGINASPSTMTFTAQAGGPLTAGQTLQITHGGGAVNWQSSSDVTWINLSQPTGTTPSTVQVFVNPQGLGVGTHLGSLRFTTGSGEVRVPVTLNITPAPPPGDPTLRASPDAVFGSVTPQSPQTSWQVRVETPPGQSLEVKAEPTVDWLTVPAPPFGNTPFVFQIVADATKLAPGQYQGAVIVSTTNLTGIRTSTVVNVTLAVGQGPAPGPSGLVVSRPVLVFEWRAGDAVPPPQRVLLAAGGPVPLTWTATKTVNWLNLSALQGTTPGEMEISVSPQLLGTGNYRGEIRFTRGAEEVAVITVLLSNTGPGTIRANPVALVYIVEPGRQPGPQLFELTRQGNVVTATYNITKTPEWLEVSPRSGQTPARLEARILRDKLPQAGATDARAEGDIEIETSAGGLRVPVIVSILAFQPGTPGADAPWILSVTNSASTEPGPVAPGELVTLYGGFKGNAVDVLFDSTKGTVLYRDENQMNAIVPFAVAGRASVRARVEADGRTSRELELRVADTAPGLYTVNGSGRGYAAALNEDGSHNWEAPAERGRVIVVYATGFGQTDPPGVDGAVVRGAPLPAPRARVEATIGGRSADVLFCGTPPGFVHGAMQCNLRVAPDAVFDAGSGDAAITLRAGGAETPPGVRVRLR